MFTLQRHLFTDLFVKFSTLHVFDTFLYVRQSDWLKAGQFCLHARRATFLHYDNQHPDEVVQGFMDGPIEDCSCWAKP